ncbi:hypothetical protein [Thioalkalivibrio sp. HK1]|uniref:hypothetical protein n=1 Tax=Thioalkalivibrio sp. HK1 TaxID=1469245 RepID=UPI0004B57B57|nr:hypothetical protein [Thioalkalivibrio sp. HK1]
MKSVHDRNKALIAPLRKARSTTGANKPFDTHWREPSAETGFSRQFPAQIDSTHSVTEKTPSP